MKLMSANQENRTLDDETVDKDYHAPFDEINSPPEDSTEPFDEQPPLPMVIITKNDNDSSISSNVAVPIGASGSFDETVVTEGETDSDTSPPQVPDTPDYTNKRIKWADQVIVPGSEHPQHQPLATVRIFRDNVEYATIRLVFLLLLEQKDKFEFIHCEISTEDRLRVSDALGQLPGLASMKCFHSKKKSRFVSLIREAAPYEEFLNIMPLQECSLKDGDILVAVHEGSVPRDCLATAHRILSANKKMIRKAVRRARIRGRALHVLQNSEKWLETKRRRAEQRQPLLLATVVEEHPEQQQPAVVADDDDPVGTSDEEDLQEAVALPKDASLKEEESDGDSSQEDEQKKTSGFLCKKVLRDHKNSSAIEKLKVAVKKKHQSYETMASDKPEEKKARREKSKEKGGSSKKRAGKRKSKKSSDERKSSSNVAAGGSVAVGGSPVPEVKEEAAVALEIPWDELMEEYKEKHSRPWPDSESNNEKTGISGENEAAEYDSAEEFFAALDDVPLPNTQSTRHDPPGENSEAEEREESNVERASWVAIPSSATNPSTCEDPQRENITEEREEECDDGASDSVAHAAVGGEESQGENDSQEKAEKKEKRKADISVILSFLESVAPQNADLEECRDSRKQADAGLSSLLKNGAVRDVDLEEEEEGEEVSELDWNLVFSKAGSVHDVDFDEDIDELDANGGDDEDGGDVFLSFSESASAHDFAEADLEQDTIQIVILLVHGSKSNFEFVHCEFSTEERLLVKDVLRQLPFLASSPTFFNPDCRFGSLLRDDPPNDELLNILTLQDYPLRNGEVLIAVHEGAFPRPLLRRARSLIQAHQEKAHEPDYNRAVVQQLQSSAQWAAQKSFVVGSDVPTSNSSKHERTLLWI